MSSTTTINTPQFLHLTVKATPELPSVQMRVIHDARRGVYVPASIALEHPAVAVTPTLLSKMRLGAVRRDALRAALSEKNVELTQRAAVKSYFRGSTGRAVSEKVRLDPTDEHLETAALIHRLARLVGDFPAQSIARSFGLQHSDAKRWVQLARKNGQIR